MATSDDRLLAAVLHLSGCLHSWKPSKVATEQTVQDERLVQVQLTDGSEVLIAHPWVRDDTLGGERYDHHSPFQRDRPWAVPMDSVAVIKIREINTAMAVAFIVVASVAGVAALTAMYYSGALD